MSGTSLDGLDIAFCRFEKDKSWQATIELAETIQYPANWLSALKGSMKMEASVLANLHIQYGHFIGEEIVGFINKHNIRPDFICSHGHTVFHQPEAGYTLQIGDGNAIAAETGLPVVFDFRSLDVALGGQGAPLVPVGDRLLFDAFDYCLNLGGIANISYEDTGKRLAFDICPANMILNELAQTVGEPFDRDGVLASTGKPDPQLLSQLNELKYYSRSGVKTLGREWFESTFKPLFDDNKIDVRDKLATAVEHIAIQVGKVLEQGENKKMLVTGGGALNNYLIERMKQSARLELVIPDVKIINYKEALIFAFLGVLRWKNEINCYSSVTGARRDSCSGVVVR